MTTLEDSGTVIDGEPVAGVDCCKRVVFDDSLSSLSIVGLFSPFGSSETPLDDSVASTVPLNCLLSSSSEPSSMVNLLVWAVGFAVTASDGSFSSPETWVVDSTPSVVINSDSD